MTTIEDLGLDLLQPTELEQIDLVDRVADALASHGLSAQMPEMAIEFPTN